MSDLFATVEAEATGTKRSITGAAMLKTYAMGLASEIMTKIPTADADFIEQIRVSQTDTTALDNLVQQECGAKLNNIDVSAFGEEEAAKLLKSNQSNRSRRKAMPMTQSNYVEMLTAAIAEWVIRESCGITKHAGSFGTGRQAMVINEATVEQLANDQEALGRAIRNIQSKKSTYKGKHLDTDYANDAEWLELCEQEAMLKAVRKTQPAGRKGLSIKKALQFIFDGVGAAETLDRDTCISVITACKDLANGVYPEEFIDAVNAQQAAEAAETLQDTTVEAPAEDVYAE